MNVIKSKTNKQNINKIISFDNISYILSFFLILFSSNYIDNVQIAKYIIMFFLGIYILINSKIIFYEKNYIGLNFLIIIYALWSLISSFVNVNIISNRNTFLASIIYCGSFLELILVFEISSIKCKSNIFMKILTFFYFFFCLITDIQILYYNLTNILTDSTVFLIGNKFNVTYFHIQFIVLLWLIQKKLLSKENKFLLIALILYSIYLSKVVMCTTSIFALIFLLVLVLFEKKLKKIITSKIFLLLLFALSASFIFWYNILINLDGIKELFNYFGEDLINMSGRVNVFNSIVEICNKKWLFGYGYASSNYILMLYTETMDAQNGFWELVVYSGYIGAFLYSFIIFLPYKKSQKNYDYFPLFAYITIMIIVAFIEIPYNNVLLFFTSIIYISKNSLFTNQ